MKILKKVNKKLKTINILILFFLLTSCSTFEMHLKDESIKDGVENILIGYFERRNLKYDPYVVNNFRDSLRFQFFKLGYRPKLLNLHDDTSAGINIKSISDLNRTKIKSLCDKYSAEIFIQGSISEREIGDITDRDISTMIIFQIYNNDGVYIGEARFIENKTLADADVINNISKEFAQNLKNRMK